MWIEGVFFDDVETRQPICGLNSIPSNRWKQQCDICKKRVGAVVACDTVNCKAKFHAMCALESEGEYSMIITTENDQPTRQVACKLHAK